MANNDTKGSKAERDAAAKAVIDNMARLKALRLAREAAAPPAPVKKKAAGKSTAAGGKTSAKGKSQALADWLASQQSGGRRT